MLATAIASIVGSVANVTGAILGVNQSERNRLTGTVQAGVNHARGKEMATYGAFNTLIIAMVVVIIIGILVFGFKTK
jgi:hypothetical protein